MLSGVIDKQTLGCNGLNLKKHVNADELLQCVWPFCDSR